MILILSSISATNISFSYQRHTQTHTHTCDYDLTVFHFVVQFTILFKAKETVCACISFRNVINYAGDNVYVSIDKDERLILHG